MTCAFNKCAKINTCIGVVLLVVGVIVCISANASAESVTDKTMGGGRTVDVEVGNDD